MEEGLLLDGVGMDGAGISIDQAIIFAVPIFSHPANASLPSGDPASMGTELAPDLSCFKWSVKGREFRFDQPFFHRLGLRRLRDAKEAGCRCQTETCPKGFEEFPFRPCLAEKRGGMFHAYQNNP